MTSVLSISGDTDGLRASEGYHAVEHAHTNRHLGCLRAGLPRPQAGTREHLEPVHQGLGQRAPVVAGCLLPFAPAAALDRIDSGIAPSGTGRAGRPRLRSLTRRNRWDRAARGDLSVTRLGGIIVEFNGMDAPTRSGINVPKWKCRSNHLTEGERPS